MQQSEKRHLSDFMRIHFVGIGGIGMSALARLCLSERKIVSGSDRTTSPITTALAGEGVHLYPQQVAENISRDIDLVVYTEAMPKDHEELVAAKKMGITTMNYFEALGLVANEYYLIAVAGSHGKTTTTAMLIDILEDGGLDPSAVVGSLRARTKSNYRAGKGKYFIVEACEYKRDFLSLKPDVLVITNIEYEHVDYYPNLRDVQEAFKEFAAQVREGGVVIVNFVGENIAPILQGLTVPIIDYGKYFNPMLALKVPGVHNQLNAAAATAAAAFVGVPRDAIQRSLKNFAGTWRRFEYKGELNGAKVYDDYGHHPSEIRATLQGAREMYPHKKLMLVFQPHTYTRVAELFDDFVTELGKADCVLLVPIYAAREVNTKNISSEQLADALHAKGVAATHFETLESATQHIKETATDTDLILVMGAGDVTHIADELTEQQ